MATNEVFTTKLINQNVRYVQLVELTDDCIEKIAEAVVKMIHDDDNREEEE